MVLLNRLFGLTRLRSAFALITVLATLSIVLVLLLAVLQSGRAEIRSAQLGSDQRSLMGLKDTATNLVIAQIRAATTLGNEGERKAWANQPGAIRVYDQGGSFEAGFKLFSDEVMRVGSESQLTQSDQIPADWNLPENLRHFVDLNEPVIRADGSEETLYFPIIDPRSALSSRGAPAVEGFDYDPDAVTGAMKSGALNDSRLPMPVRWLYVLQDGSVGYLDSSGVFVGATEATRENPIVGRMAFWTDDESSKLNINTSSEPTPWDTPRSTNKVDFDYGRYQPARKEYQRYPGHPMMTGLSPVLFPDTDLTADQKEQIYDVIPRVVPGGTVGETRAATVPPGTTLGITS